VILGDANVPNGKLKEHLRHFCQATKAISDLNSTRTICAFTFPDIPSDSSAKGLDDEETKIKAEFTEVGHSHDCRFIINLKPSPTVPLVMFLQYRTLLRLRKTETRRSVLRSVEKTTGPIHSLGPCPEVL